MRNIHSQILRDLYKYNKRQYGTNTRTDGLWEKTRIQNMVMGQFIFIYVNIYLTAPEKDKLVDSK